MMDFSSFIQPPESPIAWASLNQRTREGAVDVATDARHLRQQQAQFDVGAEQNQQQIDETQRSHAATESYQQGTLELERQRQEYVMRQAEMKRRLDFRADKAALLKTMRRKEDVNGGVRALQEAYGFVVAPGKLPQQDPAMAQGGGVVQDPMAPAGSEYEQAIGGIPGIEAGAEDGLLKRYDGSHDPSLKPETVAQVAELGDLPVTDQRPGQVPKGAQMAPVERTDEDDLALEQALSQPVVDLKRGISEQEAEEALERFNATRDKILSFKITDPAVEGAALNMLADATGQPRVAPTMPVPHPMAPPEAQVTPEGMIPPEVLAIINDAREDTDDVAAGLASTDGDYHVIDQNGQVVDEGNLWQEQRDEDVAAAYKNAMSVFESAFADKKDSYEYKLLAGHAKAYSEAWTDDERKPHMQVLQQLLHDLGSERRAKIMAQQRDESSDRAGVGQQLQIIKAVDDREKAVLSEVKGALNFKAIAGSDAELARDAEILATNPNPQQQRILRRRMATAIEPRLTDADAREYQEAGLLSRLTEMKNRLAGQGELDPAFLDTMRDTIRQSQDFARKRMKTFMGGVETALMRDSSLQNMGLTDEELWDRKENALARVIPGYEPRSRRAKSKLGSGEAPRSSSKSTTKKLSAEEMQLLGIEPL